MTSTPDPVDSGDLDLPRDPADYAPRRRGLGLAFWSVIVFGFLCILAGVAIDRFGPVWFPIKRPAPPAVAPAAPAPAADLARPSPPAALEPTSAPGPDMGALGDRLDRLETGQRLTARAAGEALAAASLSEAARASGPFADQLAPLARLLPDSQDWRALEQLAQTGAPSRSSLAAEFADLADRAAVASRRGPEDAGLLTRLAHALEAVFTVRRIDQLTGDDPDAVLARAQRQVDDGDLDGALKGLDALPPAGRDAIAGWRLRVQHRLDIDRLVASIRADAARDLAAASGGWSDVVIRALLILLVLLALAAGVALLAAAGEPGRASIEWLGWRVHMTAAAAAATVLIGAFLAVSLWRLGFWMLDTPRRDARRRAETRRRQGAEALTKGFLAAAAGDGAEARRLAQRAGELVQDTPALVRVLVAQAAETAGDQAAAHAAYTAMLGFPEMRLAGRRGLMLNAQAKGDRGAAIRHAQAAYDLTRTTRWAWRALLEDRLEAGDWTAALDLVKNALERKIVSPISAERARAALLAASAAKLEADPDPKARAQALEFANQSARLDPGFAPGVVIAARLMQATGRIGRAEDLINQAWKAAPHPALWLQWRDLRTAENPKERAARFAALAALNPDHRESRFLKVEQALLLRDAKAARAAAEQLVDDPPAPPSSRVCALMARIGFADGQADEARAWMARGAAAPQEPAWSDLDPQGRAFAYSAADWARLVAAYAETGELVHPRFERREKSLTELPELPPSYEPAPILDPREALALAPTIPARLARSAAGRRLGIHAPPS